ncbi:DUF4395 domain-containing protein [Desulfitobacterium sp. Sab5]|uniref:DUF4395 domain-containing protein n=1 Tax=Desulfitobacterium nosdiversum TaxID=3375356 RepID=UPI003CF49B66
MNEIPVPYLRANQTGIVAFVILAVVIQNPFIVALLWLIEVSGLLFAAKANLFIRLAKPFLTKWVAKSQTEARELTRFNNTLAVIFLTLSLILFGLGLSLAGYIVAGLLAIVAFVAICGYCLGCFLYFQYKQFRNRNNCTRA